MKTEQLQPSVGFGNSESASHACNHKVDGFGLMIGRPVTLTDARNPRRPSDNSIFSLRTQGEMNHV